MRPSPRHVGSLLAVGPGQPGAGGSRMGEQLVQDEEFWRERAEQLQTALNSRIVVEQAKGMLRERFGLDTQGAFALLRSAARGEGVNIPLVAGMVTAPFAAPGPRVWGLARQQEMFAAISREARVMQPAEFFRRLNEAM